MPDSGVVYRAGNVKGKQQGGHVNNSASHYNKMN